MNRMLYIAITVIAVEGFFSVAFAWGKPHHTITRAAGDVLTDWQKQMMGSELKALADSYCMIPDNVYSDKENAPFAAMEGHPGEVYLQKLHLPQAEQVTNYETVRYFMGKAVMAWRQQQAKDAAKFMGTICHIVEDFGSPSHTVPGDNQFTLLQQFLPSSELMRDKLLHGPIENGDFSVEIKGYRPKLLGVTVEEASWRLLHRIHEGIIHARSTTVPIMMALYAGDDIERVKHQKRAATKDAEILADALHSILCIGAERFNEDESKECQTAALGALWPMEAVHLFYPQSHFFSAPYWGHARHGVTLESGKKSIPLTVRAAKGSAAVEQTFANGISTGVGKALSFHLPKGVFQKFRVMAGLQVGLGDKGRVEFVIVGDTKVLAIKTVSGTDPAAEIECDVSDVGVLQLNVQSRGLDPNSNYAIWADPNLVKAAP